MDQQRYFVPLPRETPHQQQQQQQQDQSNINRTPFTLLRSRVDTLNSSEAIYETPIQDLATMMKGHLVCGTALCPASVYTEMVLAAITCLRGSDAEMVVFKLSAIKFLRPLIYIEGATDTIRITLEREETVEGITPFTVSSYATPSSDTKVHCSGIIKEQPQSQASSKLRVKEQALARRKVMFQTGDHQTLSTAIMYDKIFSRVVDYSSVYQGVKKIYLDGSLEEIFARCVLPPAEESSYAGQPILLDTMLHIAGFAANLSVDNDTVCICHHIQSTILFRKDIGAGQSFDVHCSNFTNTDGENTILADAHAVDRDGIIAVIRGMEFRRAKLSKLRAAFEFASQAAPSRGSRNALLPSCNPTRQREEILPPEPSLSISSSTSPTRSSSSPTTSRSPTTTQDTVITILSEATGVDQKNINTRTTLAAMGVDSIMMFELDRKLEEAMEAQKPTVAELSACKTVGDMEALISASASRGEISAAVTRKTSKSGRAR